jgi:hypothetical protein
MSQQTICDQCGEPIDTTQSWVNVAVMQAGPVTGPPQAANLDYHIDHVPAELRAFEALGG